MSEPLSLAASDSDAPLAINQHQAARITAISAKSLERLAAAGEAVGRFKAGRRVLYHMPTLAAWLARRAANVEGGKS